MQKITNICNSCGKTIKGIPREYIGRKVKCPYCKTPFVVAKEIKKNKYVDDNNGQVSQKTKNLIEREKLKSLKSGRKLKLKGQTVAGVLEFFGAIDLAIFIIYVLYIFLAVISSTENGFAVFLGLAIGLTGVISLSSAIVCFTFAAIIRSIHQNTEALHALNNKLK